VQHSAYRGRRADVKGPNAAQRRGRGAFCWSRPAVLLSCRCEGDGEVLQRVIFAKSLNDTECCSARRPNGTVGKLQAALRTRATRQGSCRDKHSRGGSDLQLT
jgi:hypothetical protein